MLKQRYNLILNKKIIKSFFYKYFICRFALLLIIKYLKMETMITHEVDRLPNGTKVVRNFFSTMTKQII